MVKPLWQVFLGQRLLMGQMLPMPQLFLLATLQRQQLLTIAQMIKWIISYQDSANSNYGTLIVGTVSGTSISFETPVVFEAASTNYTTSVFDTNSKKVVVAYRDQGNSNYGTSVVFQKCKPNN